MGGGAAEGSGARERSGPCGGEMMDPPAALERARLVAAAFGAGADGEG